MKHKILINARAGSYTVSAECSCGQWNFYRNLYASRGYTTKTIASARYDFKLHKAGTK
jgi:hypothetical protein